MNKRDKESVEKIINGHVESIIYEIGEHIYNQYPDCNIDKVMDFVDDKFWEITKLREIERNILSL